MPKKLTGRCACGSIRYQLVAKPMFVHCCHCDDCQRATGSAFVLNAIIETDAIKLLRSKSVAVPVPRALGRAIGHSMKLGYFRLWKQNVVIAMHSLWELGDS